MEYESWEAFLRGSIRLPDIDWSANREDEPTGNEGHEIGECEYAVWACQSTASKERYYYGSTLISKVAIASLKNKHGGSVPASDSCGIKDASESRIVGHLKTSRF
jgi:hypothetical protein